MPKRPPIIRFLHKPALPFQADCVRGFREGDDLDGLSSARDRQIIDEVWRDVEGRGCYTRRGGLGSLWDSSDWSRLSFRPTEYKTYLAACRHSPFLLSTPLYDAMKVASVGATVRTADHKYLVHRRSLGAAHLPGFLDCSAAGLCPVASDGALDLRAAVLEKLSRELALAGADIAVLAGTGIHSVPHPSWSGMVTFRIETPLSFAALEQRINRQYLEGVVGIDEDSAGDWIVDSLCHSGELLADGAATLLSALPHPAFLVAIQAIRKAGGIVRFGQVQAGRFVEAMSGE
jgi:hypothetical protein